MKISSMARIINVALSEAIVGMPLGENLFDNFGILLGRSGESITPAMLSDLADSGFSEIPIMENDSRNDVKSDIQLASPKRDIDFNLLDLKIDKIFAMVAQYEEIQQISSIIKKIVRKMPSQAIFHDSGPLEEKQ